MSFSIFASIDLIKISKLGSKSLCISINALIHIAVGITSLELWLIFTSSLASIDNLDAFEARLAITSFAFMLVLVPEPVWKTSRGNASSYRPLITSFEAALIGAAFFALNNFNF